MQDNKFRQPLIIIFSAIVMLYLLSFVSFDYQILDFQLRNVDIFIDLKTIPEFEIPYEEPDSTSSGSINNGAELNTASLNPLPVLKTVSDFFVSSLPKEETPVMIFQQGKAEPISGSVKDLQFFFSSLKSASNRKIRVAHYGDSVIEGDYVTADIREVLQNKFGGGGVGWMGIISQDINFRLTTKHSFGGNWDNAALYTLNPDGLPLGISGEIAIPKGDAWVKYEAAKYHNAQNDFSVVRLFYGNAGNSKMYYSFNNGPRQSADLKSGDGIQELVMMSSEKAYSVKLEFPTSGQAYIYGVSLEKGSGVYVDNFPLRGNSGVDLNKLNSAMLSDFGKYLDYKLIILEFGLNIEGSYRTDYTWYGREMDKVVKHLQSSFPGSSIVLMGVHDRSMKRGSEFVTDPGILSLLETQKRIVAQNNIAFFSLFDAMGGMNSMRSWVLANPPLASRDYVHFNPLGASKLALLFTDALLKEYENNQKNGI